jgi:hypothetical protein
MVFSALNGVGVKSEILNGVMGIFPLITEKWILPF